MITRLSISELVNSTNSHYLIPIYQRNYDWSNVEIETLIQDLIDFINDTSFEQDSTKCYYLGTLIVSERIQETEQSNEIKQKSIFEVIDGQQRLTTLNLLYLYLSSKYDVNSQYSDNFSLNLSFENRESAKKAFELIAHKDFKMGVSKNIKGLITTDDVNENIINGLDIITKFLDSNSHITLNDQKKLFEALQDKVIIFRVSLPEKTDLNHYFEIMNNRGEQLEQHEIIKAQLIAELDEDDNSRELFAIIWDACSNFDTPIQKTLTNITDCKGVYSIADSFVFNSNNLKLELNDLNNIYNAKKITTSNSSNLVDSNKLFEIIKNADLNDKNRKPLKSHTGGDQTLTT